MDQYCGDDYGYGAEGVGEYVQPDSMHIFVIMRVAVSVTLGMRFCVARF